MKLVDDPRAVVCSPRPAVLKELFSSDLILVDSLFPEMFGDLDFRRDRGVVCSRLPEGFEALHSLPADENVLQSIIKGMAHMQLPGNVWRRHDDRERLFVRVYFRTEISSVEPLLIQPVLQAFRVISLSEFHPVFLLLKFMCCTGYLCIPAVRQSCRRNVVTARLPAGGRNTHISDDQIGRIHRPLSVPAMQLPIS